MNKYKCIYIYIYMYVCMYACIYIYIYMRSFRRRIVEGAHPKNSYFISLPHLYCSE